MIYKIKKIKKNPSSFNLTFYPKHYNIENYNYINLSTQKNCGPAYSFSHSVKNSLKLSECKISNRTRDFYVSDKCFTIKLLAHEVTMNNNYLNFCCMDN